MTEIIFVLAIAAYLMPGLAIIEVDAEHISETWHHGPGRNCRMILIALGCALFWPGAIAEWRRRDLGDDLPWVWALIGAIFYPGVLAEQIHYESH